MARILFFGRLADLAGGRMRELHIGDSVRNLRELVDLIAKGDDRLGAALREKSVQTIINERVSTGEAISDSDEIAFLPPVSGG